MIRIINVEARKIWVWIRLNTVHKGYTPVMGSFEKKNSAHLQWISYFEVYAACNVLGSNIFFITRETQIIDCQIRKGNESIWPFYRPRVYTRTPCSFSRLIKVINTRVYNQSPREIRLWAPSTNFAFTYSDHSVERIILYQYSAPDYSDFFFFFFPLPEIKKILLKMF